ncbi:MAG: M1 family metallopeptidase [Bacteroidota bacterium]
MSIPKLLSALVFCLTAISEASGQDYYERQPAIDIQHYTFDLTLSDDSNSIKGQASIDIEMVHQVASFKLDLISPKGGHGMTVKAVKLGNVEVNFTHSEDKLNIELPASVKENDLFEVTITYEGIPADGLIIAKNKYGDRTFFGDNWPNRARNWLPSIDHPYDKASVDFVVTAPEHYKVIANGIKREESSLVGGMKRTHWYEDVDIPTKVMVIGAARFAIQHVTEYEGIPVESWVYPQNREAGFYDYAMATKSLALFHQHIGPYSYDKLANVQSKTRYGGMENASNIFYYENSVTGNRTIEALIAHEVAHQWFGNSASEKDWHHIWLSEGFATYFASWYMGFVYGKDKMDELLIEDRQEVIDFHRREQVPIVNKEIRDYNQLLNANSYQKGGWVLHMLSVELGQDVFMQGIRKYYETFRNGNALTADLRQVMESVSSKQLDWFFEQWIFKAGHPKLELNWKYNEQKDEINISLVQVQKEGAFQFPVDLEIIDTKGKSQRQTIRMTEKMKSLTLKMKQAPAKVIIDPDTRLLFEEVSKN